MFCTFDFVFVGFIKTVIVTTTNKMDPGGMWDEMAGRNTEPSWMMKILGDDELWSTNKWTQLLLSISLCFCMATALLIAVLVFMSEQYATPPHHHHHNIPLFPHAVIK